MIGQLGGARFFRTLAALELFQDLPFSWRDIRGARGGFSWSERGNPREIERRVEEEGNRNSRCKWFLSGMDGSPAPSQPNIAEIDRPWGANLCASSQNRLTNADICCRAAIDFRERLAKGWRAFFPIELAAARVALVAQQSHNDGGQ